MTFFRNRLRFDELYKLATGKKLVVGPHFDRKGRCATITTTDKDGKRVTHHKSSNWNWGLINSIISTIAAILGAIAAILSVIVGIVSAIVGIVALL